MNNLFSNNWFTVLLAFLVSFILIKVGVPAWLVSVLFVVFAYFLFSSPIFASKSVSSADKRTILYEQILSVLRKVLAILASLLALGVFDKVPILGNIQNVLVYLAENWAMTTGSLEVLIGTVLFIICQFSSNQRFEFRAGKRIR